VREERRSKNIRRFIISRLQVQATTLRCIIIFNHI